LLIALRVCAVVQFGSTICSYQNSNGFEFVTQHPQGSDAPTLPKAWAGLSRSQRMSYMRDLERIEMEGASLSEFPVEVGNMSKLTVSSKPECRPTAAV
jgi:hypothetical protein